MARVRRILLHPGFHRTGCQSIQDFFRQNQKALAPSVRMLFVDDMRPVIRIGRHDAPAGRAAIARAVGLVFNDLGDDPRDIVISAEALCGAPAGRPETMDYNASPAAIADLTEALVNHFDGKAKVIVALTARDSEDWLFSAFQSQVRNARLRIGRAEFAAAHRRATEFDRLAAELTRHLTKRGIEPAVHLMWLEQIAEHPLGPGGALLDLLGKIETSGALSAVPFAETTLPTPFWHMFLAINRSRNPDKAVRAAKDDLIAQHGYGLSKPRAKG